MRLNLRLNSNNWWDSIKPSTKWEQSPSGHGAGALWMTGQGWGGAGQGSPSTSSGTTTAPALLPPEHGTEPPMLITTIPESICRSRSASVIKMTLLTTPIISNDFSVYLHTPPSCRDAGVFLKTRSRSQNTFWRTLNYCPLWGEI